MDTADQNNKLAAHERIEAHREVIRLSLDDIAVEVETGLQNASLNFPVYLVVLSSGNSIVTIATLLDPSDDNWSQASEIVCRLVGEKLGGARLHSRPLQCSVANANFSAADVIQDAARA